MDHSTTVNGRIVVETYPKGLKEPSVSVMTEDHTDYTHFNPFLYAIQNDTRISDSERIKLVVILELFYERYSTILEGHKLNGSS